MPSISRYGSPSRIMRSEKVPESPSSALQTMNFCAAGWSCTVCHLMPQGKAAPPRPRNPDSVTAETMSCGVMASARRAPCQPPWASKSSRLIGSMMPLREKHTRCCCFNQSMSSTGPRHSAWVSAFGKPASNNPATDSTVSGPNPMRPRSLSTSTSGSSQHIPRDPLRTSSMAMPRACACSSMAAATSSAPQAFALVSRGT
jgi:hypothetical protein